MALVGADLAPEMNPDEAHTPSSARMRSQGDQWSTAWTTRRLKAVRVTGWLAGISAAVARGCGPGWQFPRVPRLTRYTLGCVHCRGSGRIVETVDRPPGDAQVRSAFLGNCRILSTSFVVSSGGAAGTPVREACQCLLRIGLRGGSTWESQKSSRWALAGVVEAMAEVEAMGEVGVTAANAVTEVTEATVVTAATPVTAVAGVTATAVMGPAAEAVTTEAATAAAGADTELTPVMGSRIIEAGSCSVSVIGL